MDDLAPNGWEELPKDELAENQEFGDPLFPDAVKDAIRAYGMDPDSDDMDHRDILQLKPHLNSQGEEVQGKGVYDNVYSVKGGKGGAIIALNNFSPATRPGNPPIPPLNRWYVNFYTSLLSFRHPW